MIDRTGRWWQRATAAFHPCPATPPPRNAKEARKAIGRAADTFARTMLLTPSPGVPRCTVTATLVLDGERLPPRTRRDLYLQCDGYRGHLGAHTAAVDFDTRAGPNPSIIRWTGTQATVTIHVVSSWLRTLHTRPS